MVVYRASKDMIVLHRVVGEGLLQGDANDEAQEVKLTRVNLIGKEKFTIPGLGSVVKVILSFPVWLVIAILIVCTLIPTHTPPTTSALLTPPSSDDQSATPAPPTTPAPSATSASLTPDDSSGKIKPTSDEQSKPSNGSMSGQS